MLGVSYDGMSSNLFSLADWFKVIDKVSELWRHALVLWIGNLQSGVEGVLVFQKQINYHSCSPAYRSPSCASGQRSCCLIMSLPFTSSTEEAGVFSGGSDYFLFELRGKLWQLDQRASPQRD